MLITCSRTLLRCDRLVHRPTRMFIRNRHKGGTSRRVTWEKPEIGWTKLNFDGSCKSKTGRSSIGGIFRNHEAEFLLGYAESIGESNSTNAELAALRRGMELVLENGWTDIWVEGDSKSLVDMIVRKRAVRCAEAQKHLHQIYLIIPELDRFTVTHVFREGNRAADKFAQLGHHLNHPHIWRDAPPMQVTRIVDEDAQGKSFLRSR